VLLLLCTDRHGRIVNIHRHDADFFQISLVIWVMEYDVHLVGGRMTIKAKYSAPPA
jgi:hypothetical protein